MTHIRDAYSFAANLVRELDRLSHSIATMDGGLALMATLASFGGRWLRDGSGPPPELAAHSKSFQYVGSFLAEFPSRRFSRTAMVARRPEEWLRALKTSGVKDLSLITHFETTPGTLPPHIAVSFANGGAWGLLASGKGEPAFWTLRRDVGDREASDNRIWSLTATRHSAGGIAAPTTTVHEAAERLSAALTQIRNFAEQHDEVRRFAPWFEKSQALLSDADPAPPYHADMLPADAPVERRQLAAAAIQGWVFGGMGSWNDCGFPAGDLQREYDRVSGVLYAELLSAVATAANWA